MSIAAFRICRSSRTWLTLGNPCEVGPMRTFWYHDITLSDTECARALWKVGEG